MFNKKVLSLAVASVATGMALSAHAVINLDDNSGEVTYAQETVEGNTSGLYVVTDGGGDGLDVQAELGVGVAGDDQIFVRFDLSAGVWGAGLANSTLEIGGVTGNIAQDGAASDSAVIYAVTAPTGTTGFDQADVVDLNLDTVALAAPAQALDITMGVFETLTLAINNVSPLNSQTTSDAVSLAAALSTDFTANTLIADVEEDFLRFVSNATDGALGSIDFNVATALFNASNGNTTVSLGDIIDDASTEVTYTGAFDFGTFELDSASACGTVVSGLSVDTTTNTEAEATGDIVDGNFLCVSVSGTESIPEAVYSATVDFADANTGSAFLVPDASGDAGTIVRNGTTVEIAYVTTFDAYNQRIILVNRNSVPVDYSFSFSTEAGVTATDGSAADGTLQPGENLVLRARDIVTLTGGTRCAATFTAVSPSGRIDVATTQVNLADGGTDTVRYE